MNKDDYKKYFNYVDIDYQNTKNRILTNLSIFLPEYAQNESENDFGMFLVNQLAIISEIFATYSNIVHNETNPMSAQLMSSILNHIDFYDYEYHLPRGSLTYLHLKIVPDIIPITISKGNKFKGSYLQKEIIFENMEDINIDAGQTRYNPTYIISAISVGDTTIVINNTTGYKVGNKIAVEYNNIIEAKTIIKIENQILTLDVPFLQDFPNNSIVSKLILVRQGETIVEYLGISTGEEDQIFPLRGGQVHITEDFEKLINVRVETNNVNTDYYAVTHFVAKNIDENSTIFKLNMNRYGDQFVQFGQNGFGKTPPLGSKIYATYMVCNGTLGNVPKGSINTTDNEYIEECFNPFEATGGTDSASLNKIKEDFIAWRKNKKVGFNEDSIISIANGLPEIKRSTCLIDGKVIRLIIIPTQGIITDELRQYIYKYFRDKILGGYILTIESAILEKVNINIKVKCDINSDFENIDLVIRSVIMRLFDTFTFNTVLYVSDIHKELSKKDVETALKNLGVYGYDVISLSLEDNEKTLIKADFGKILGINQLYIEFEKLN